MCTHSPYQFDHQSETNCDFNITLWSSNNFQSKIWMHCVYKDDLNWLFSIIQSSIPADNFLITRNHRANSTLLTHLIRFIPGLFFLHHHYPFVYDQRIYICALLFLLNRFLFLTILIKPNDRSLTIHYRQYTFIISSVIATKRYFSLEFQS